jgi:sulfoxide reductase heme-binding subunit YedZ
MIASTVGSHFCWITSRAAGIACLLLASASVGVGLSISGRLLKTRGPDLRVTHEALSVAAIATLVLHAATLLGDSYFHPSVGDLVIPFQLDYKEPYMAIGIIGGWAMVICGLSYYVRERIGIARWKVLHRFTAVAWILGVIHTLGEGSDAGAAWFLVVVAVAVVPVIVLGLTRTLTMPAPAAPAPVRVPAPPRDGVPAGH